MNDELERMWKEEANFKVPSPHSLRRTEEK
jgi:hypothetical protein